TSKNFADKIPEDKLENPTATLFISGDVAEALKRLAKINKDTGLPKIKIGIIDGEILDETQIMRISSLPSRDVLIAQFVGTLNSPIQGLVVTLNANLQKFVMVLDGIAKSKPASSPAPQPEPQPQEQAPTASSEETTKQVENAATPTPNSAPAEVATTSEAETPTKQSSVEDPVEEKEQTENKGGENQ
ncbi:MAG TPA: 50S ribosomal protein L10, partial [Chlamydiales bacterium]|nr:50S ribosomal protein L10 [Chlamydiales bacterium]